MALGDRIDIGETQTGHSGSYFIIGEVHKLTIGATLYETTWYLEPTPNPYPWCLGYDLLSEFDEHGVLLAGNTYLAY